MSFMLLLFSVCSLLGTLVEVLGKKMEGVGGIQKHMTYVRSQKLEDWIGLPREMVTGWWGEK